MIKYLRENWKQMIHLILGTYRFGVNNEWWSTFDSLFGIPLYNRTPRRMIQNYRMARFRAINCFFVTTETAWKLFPITMWKKRRKQNGTSGG